jgi:hypothetical protein
MSSDAIIERLKGYFARRDGKRLGLRALLAALAALLASPQGQVALAAALGPYAWAVPIVVLLVGALTNGKEKTP